MSIFLFSLAGIPPFAGWFAKFVMFRSALEVQSVASVILAVIAAVSSVVAFVYYANVVKRMWLEEPAALEEIAEQAKADGGLLIKTRTAVTTSPAVKLAILLCVIATVALGVLPGIIAKVGELITSVS